MVNGVLLYDEFRKEVLKMGGVKRAWFTTFNLNISFFEQWLLPVITSRDFVQAKSLNDYEEMNEQLTNSEENNTEAIEVKIFYDYRGLKNQDATKRTLINLHPFNPDEFGIEGNRNYFKGGVFHPKVSVLEGNNGEFYLMIASANLTFNGWARNRECFFFTKIQGVANARAIGQFFYDCMVVKNEFSLINKLLRSPGWGDMPKWKFVSSFTGSFADELSGAIDKERPLHVWSPYWSEDLPHLINQIRGLGHENVFLIPSKNSSGKLAITKTVFDECKTIDGIKFIEEDWKKEDRPFIHAKVWMTQSKIALGSWNATRAGTNIQVSEKRTANTGNNVEAGVIVDLKKEDYDLILKQAKFKPLENTLHLTEEELDKEKQAIIENFEFPIEITADWTKGEYTLAAPTLKDIPEKYMSKGFIQLPGSIMEKLSNFINPVKFRGFQTALLNNRFFTFENEGKIIYHGYINEVGLEDRPINEFDNEIDLLMSWIDGSPEGRTDLLKKNIPIEEDEQADANEIGEVALTVVKPWFNNLQGFARIRNKIKLASEESTKESRKTQLRRIGRIIPGSISELKIKMEKRLESYKEIPVEKQTSPVFLWFMIEETNRCIDYFNKHIKDQDDFKSEVILRIKNIEIENFILEKDKEVKDAEKLKEYLSKIKETLKQGL